MDTNKVRSDTLEFLMADKPQDFTARTFSLYYNEKYQLTLDYHIWSDMFDRWANMGILKVTSHTNDNMCVYNLTSIRNCL